MTAIQVTRESAWSRINFPLLSLVVAGLAINTDSISKRVAQKSFATRSNEPSCYECRPIGQEEERLYEQLLGEGLSQGQDGEKFASDAMRIKRKNKLRRMHRTSPQ